MKQQDNLGTNDQSIIIEDLSAQNADEIKGGPTPKSKRVVVLQSSVADSATSGLTDLEPQGDIVGGLKGAPQTCVNNTDSIICSNHNETVAADETQGASLADLAAQNADEIKGGPKRIFIGGLSVNESPNALLDLEPSGEVKGGMQYRSKRSEAM